MRATRSLLGAFLVVIFGILLDNVFIYIFDFFVVTVARVCKVVERAWKSEERVSFSLHWEFWESFLLLRIFFDSPGPLNATALLPHFMPPFG